MRPLAYPTLLSEPVALPAWGRDRCDAEARAPRPDGNDLLARTLFCARPRGHDGPHRTRPRRALRETRERRWRCHQWERAQDEPLSPRPSVASELGPGRASAHQRRLAPPPARADDARWRCGDQAYLWGYLTSRAGGGWFPTDVTCNRPAGHDGPHVHIPALASWSPLRWGLYRCAVWTVPGDPPPPPVLDSMRTRLLRGALCLLVVTAAALWLAAAILG